MIKKVQTLKFLCTILLLAFANVTQAQDYSKVDNVVSAYPKSFSSPEKLAEKINADFISETDKVRAIFTWIGSIVKYDLREFNSGGNAIAFSYSSEQEKLQKEIKFRYNLALKTLRSKKGVCQGYTALFHVLCDMCQIKCIDIPGTSKTNLAQIGKLPKASDHVWNAVKIGESWKLIDVTWASGAVNTQSGKFISQFNDAYFFTNPEVMFLNHFPDDARMLMTEKSAEDFANLPLFYGDYIKSDYEITFPIEGILNLGKANVIPFKIENLPANQQISYVFTGEGIVKLGEAKTSGNATEFDVRLDSKSKGYLTVYVNNKSVVSYKIQR
ncbi:transglutaminase domain-containing protein [Flavobacterium noncentrifugens]|uniref:Transglutaminase-like superfamily protein n=1 Tax=Flavobacterium noncentrifugens TaxID=1128970 RepID=A0A1G8YDX2_9FLAO|nr:transglutaminase domain-containing protein [Flavobacterium noncentrifugens]SDK01119.1 Transglutaminase-like superfamily protein [Flavobacterium noncentrifugens]